MKLMILTPWYPTREHNYAGIFVREYAKAVQHHCNATVVHCGIANTAIPSWWTCIQEHNKDLTEGIPCYRILYRPSRIHFVPFFQNHMSCYRAIIELAKKHGRPDLIHAHVYSTGLPALLAARRLGIPIVISEHFSGFSRGLLSPRQLCEAKFVFRMADAVLPVSDTLQKTLQDLGINAAFKVVPNVVDTSLFYYEQQHLHHNRTLRLLAVNSLVKHKGMEYLFQALTMVAWKRQLWQLDVVGDGQDAVQLCQMIKDLNLTANVKFHGQLPKHEVAHLMRMADLFVLPSLIETFSVVTAEALASGLPVLVTRCGGPEGFVTDRDGVIVTPGDARALAGALTCMIERLSTYDRPAIAREAKDTYSSKSVGATLYDIYNRLVKES